MIRTKINITFLRICALFFLKSDVIQYLLHHITTDSTFLFSQAFFAGSTTKRTRRRAKKELWRNQARTMRSYGVLARPPSKEPSNRLSCRSASPRAAVSGESLANQVAKWPNLGFLLFPVTYPSPFSLFRSSRFDSNSGSEPLIAVYNYPLYPRYPLVII